MSDAPDRAPAAGLPAATAGETLRAARERQGLRIEALAAALKVPQAKLEMLEADRFDALPGVAFTRALALSVCRALKLDPEPVLARLPLAVPRDLESVSMGLNEPFRERGGRTEGLPWGSALNVQTGAAVLLVLAAAAVYWLPSALWPRWGRGDVTRVVSAPVATPVAALPSVVPEATALGASMPVPASAAAPVVEVDTVFSSPAVSEAPGDGPVAGGMLMLRAAAESWVEVRDSAGRILLSRSLAAGEAAGLDGSLPLRLVVGNAEATQVTFRGQPVSLAATRDNVARLELK